MKTILVPVSVGELADKLSILQIKAERIADARKRAHVQVELEALQPIWARIVGANPALADEHQRLKDVNALMWEVQDGLREREATATFDDEFIRLARAVAVHNGERVAIKNAINRQSGSTFVEEKQYVADR